jgi:hypothetical protein
MCDAEQQHKKQGGCSRNCNRLFYFISLRIEYEKSKRVHNTAMRKYCKAEFPPVFAVSLNKGYIWQSKNLSVVGFLILFVIIS